MDCPDCERLLKAQKEARLIYESAELLFKKDRSSATPTPAEITEQGRDSVLRLQAHLHLVYVDQELSGHQVSHQKGQKLQTEPSSVVGKPLAKQIWRTTR
jgi:hypothetical protein